MADLRIGGAWRPGSSPAPQAERGGSGRSGTGREPGPGLAEHREAEHIRHDTGPCASSLVHGLTPSPLHWTDGE